MRGALKRWRREDHKDQLLASSALIIERKKRLVEQKISVPSSKKASNRSFYPKEDSRTGLYPKADLQTPPRSVRGLKESSRTLSTPRSARGLYPKMDSIATPSPLQAQEIHEQEELEEAMYPEECPSSDVEEDFLILKDQTEETHSSREVRSCARDDWGFEIHKPAPLLAMRRRNLAQNTFSKLLLDALMRKRSEPLEALKNMILAQLPSLPSPKRSGLFPTPHLKIVFPQVQACGMERLLREVT